MLLRADTIKTIRHCGYIFLDNSKHSYYNVTEVKLQALLELHKYTEKCTMNCNDCCHVNAMNLLNEGVNEVIQVCYFLKRYIRVIVI